MASWRASVSMTDRYESIQAILAARRDPSSMSEAIAIETRAFEDSDSLEAYHDACEPSTTPTTTTTVNSSPPFQLDPPESPSSSPGIRIGDYTGCHPFASGITSTVYRSTVYALKVITATHNIEPHHPHREVKILSSLKKPCIPLIESFRDQESQLVLVFPYMPLTLATLLDSGKPALTDQQRRSALRDVLVALQHVHEQGIIHRDIKPSAVLLESPQGPAYLSDFGTAWHPALSGAAEPAHAKILDIGTGPYRAPEVLFGDKSYTTKIDMWSFGVLVSECVSNTQTPVFESRPAHEDGSQLGLILSIFKTLGTPRENDWPEANDFKVSPFELWTVFPKRSWEEVLPDVDKGWRDLVAALVRFDNRRVTASEALRFPCLQEAQDPQK